MADETDLLLAEYQSCAQVANHIDTVRNVITSFFLTINGGVLIVLTLVAKGDVSEDAFGSPQSLLAGVLLGVCTLGTLFTGTVARLRRVQSERYRIANSILDHMLTTDVRSVVALGNRTLAGDAGGRGLDKRITGTYLWSLTIMLPTAALAGLATYLIAADIHGLVAGAPAWATGVLTATAALLAQDRLYFTLSTFHPPAEGPAA